MKVLVIAHNAVGASNRRRVDVLAQQPGLDVTLLTPPWWFEEGRLLHAQSDGVSAQGYAWHVGRTLATGNGTRHVYLTRLVSLLRARQPDVIDLYEEPFSLAALQVGLLRDLLVPRAALVFYSAVNVARRWRLPYHLVEQRTLRNADGAYVPNRDVGPILRQKGFRGPIAGVPLGIDAAHFATAQPMDLAAALDGAPRPYVGFLGRLEPVKGLAYLLQAMVELPGTLVVVGEGPERNRLQALSASLGVAQRVRFLGTLPFDAAPGFMRALDVLALPSVTIPPEHREQFGRVLVEAMAAGTPVVGSDSGAIPEVIGDAGLVVPERDAGALATAIRCAVADLTSRADLVARGRARVARHFDWSVVVPRVVEVYEQALAHRRERCA